MLMGLVLYGACPPTPMGVDVEEAIVASTLENVTVALNCPTTMLFLMTLRIGEVGVTVAVPPLKVIVAKTSGPGFQVMTPPVRSRLALSTLAPLPPGPSGAGAGAKLPSRPVIVTFSTIK